MASDNNGQVYAGAANTGIWKAGSPLRSVNIIHATAPLSVVALYNEATGTTLSVRGGESAQSIRVELANITGREVARFMQPTFGRAVVRIELKNLMLLPGCYLARISTESSGTSSVAIVR